jgi:hypothetical protein
MQKSLAGFAVLAGLVFMATAPLEAVPVRVLKAPALEYDSTLLADTIMRPPSSFDDRDVSGLDSDLAISITLGRSFQLTKNKPNMRGGGGDDHDGDHDADHDGDHDSDHRGDDHDAEDHDGGDHGDHDGDDDHTVPPPGDPQETSMPEPGTLILLGSGLLAVVALRRRSGSA